MLALQALGVVGAALVVPQMRGIIEAQNATLAADPQTAEVFNNIITGTLIVGGVLGLVLVAVIVLGVLKLWRWVYWYLMISYGLALFSVPGNLLRLNQQSAVQMPPALLLFSISVGLIEFGLLIWMIVAYRRYGNWARRKIVEPA